MFIYKITNLINNKIYIGLTTQSIKRRWMCYKSNVKNKKHYNQSIIKAIIKYGIKSFIIEKIDSAINKQELQQKEIYWINFYKSINPKIGYNISPGGQLRSEKGLIKHSNKLKGRKLSQEHKNKIAQSLIGHKMSLETRQKISFYKKGHIPWNKNTKGIMKANQCVFKKGELSPNIGTTRMIDTNGKICYIFLTV